MRILLIGMICLISIAILVIVAALVAIFLSKEGRPGSETRLSIMPNARVASKRTRPLFVTGGLESDYGRQSRSACYITFELISGQRLEFAVSPSEYCMLIEGDVGHLVYEGGRFISFTRQKARA